MDIIEFRTDVEKVQTLSNGGIRLTLNLHEVPPEIMTNLIEVKMRGGCLEVAAVPVFDNELSKEKQWEDLLS